VAPQHPGPRHQLGPVLGRFAWLQSRGGTHRMGTHTALACFACAGAFFEGIDTLMILGSEATCDWLQTSFELGYGADGAGGWRALEIAWMTSQGTRLWVDAIDWLFLSLSLVLVARSVWLSERDGASVFSPKWAALSAAIGSLALVDFVAETARFAGDWRDFSIAAAFISMLNSLVLLPVWILWLGVELPRARGEVIEDPLKRAHRSSSSADRAGPAGSSPLAANWGNNPGGALASDRDGWSEADRGESGEVELAHVDLAS